MSARVSPGDARASAGLVSPVVRSWLREPVVQLVVAGAALFALLRAWGPEDVPVAVPQRIVLTDADVRAITASWEMQGRAAPSGAELESLLQARVREEVLYREAVALGLDEKDAIVRQRLAQMMEYLLDDVSGLREPDDRELRPWFARSATRFAAPARMSFRQLYFSSDRRGASARTDAIAAQAALAAAAANGVATDVTQLGDASLIDELQDDRSLDEIAAQLGPAFASELQRLPSGVWSGPIESAYGWHLVRVDARTPQKVPAFEEVEAAVRVAWSEEQRAETRRRAYDALRARYEVVLPDGRNDDAPARASEVRP